MLRKQVYEQILILKTIKESNKENSRALFHTINNLKDTLENQSTTIEHYRKEMKLIREWLNAKDKVNRMLANEISNIRLRFEDSRKHRFGRIFELKRLLNNRNIDKSAMNKSEYDGSDNKVGDNNANSHETGIDISFNDSQYVQNNKSSRKYETVSRINNTNLKVDKIVIHEVDKYYTFHEGERFMNCDGMLDVREYLSRRTCSCPQRKVTCK